MVSSCTVKAYRRLAAAVIIQAAEDADKGIRCKLALKDYRNSRMPEARREELRVLAKRGAEARAWLLHPSETMRVFAGILGVRPEYIAERAKFLRIGEWPSSQFRGLLLTPERKSRLARRSLSRHEGLDG